MCPEKFHIHIKVPSVPCPFQNQAQRLIAGVTGMKAKETIVFVRI